MASWSKRRAFLFWFAVLLIAGVVKVLGDQYLRPLPMWLLLVIAAAGVGFIAVVAIYGRRRKRRLAPPR